MFKKALATVAIGSMLVAATPAQAGETEDILGVLAIGTGIVLLASGNGHHDRDRDYDRYDRGYDRYDADRGYYDRGARNERRRVNPYNDPDAPGYARGYEYPNRTCYTTAQRGYGGRVRRIERNCYGEIVDVDRFYRRGY